MELSPGDIQNDRFNQNWYAKTEGCEITVNAHSYTIITAHRR